jgi:hypothetical protein
MSILQWISQSGDKRRSARILPEDLVAYYWTGSTPQPNQVGDVGLYGARIVSRLGFYPGTVVEFIFEDRAASRNDGVQSHHICAYGRVLRSVVDGFCVEFVFRDASERRRFRQFLGGLKRRNRDETNTEKTPNVRGADTD